MATTLKNLHQRIDECQGLVRSLAIKIRRSLPQHVDVDDLIGYAQVGLAEAARDFDPDRGIKFSTFAYYRIRGAIYDGLAKMSWFKRARPGNVKYAQMANELLRLQAEEPNRSGGKGLVDVVGWFREATSALAMVYLTSHHEDREGTLEDQLIDQSVQTPPTVLIDGEIQQTLRDLVDALPDDERTLIRVAYFEGKTLQEAGQCLGISKSWASRLHAKSLKHLAHSLRLLAMAD